MKYIDSADIENLPGRRLNDTDRFCFHCHPGLDCFNRCCRNLNLFLYPYDVIGLKHHLNISSDMFLDRYVDVLMRPGNHFPDVLLRMSDSAEKQCPFLTPSGCSVYPHRPYSCRLFPIEQGVIYRSDDPHPEIIHLFRPPPFCTGPTQPVSWTPGGWITDQQAQRYAEMTARWSEVKRLFRQNPWGPEGPGGSKGKMAFMATYNVDRFREFVLQSSFLNRYAVPGAIRKRIQTDDAELMILGIEWVKRFLWGLETPRVRSKRTDAPRKGE